MKRVIKLMAVLLSCLIIATACDSENDSSSKAGDTGNAPIKEEVIEIELMGYFVLEVSPDDSIIQHINEKFNVKINPTFTKIENYNDVLNNRIASGDIPDLFRVQTEFLFSQLVGDEVIANISEPVERLGLSNIQAQFEIPGAEFLSTKGEFYRSPNSIGHLQPNFYIREDWLEKLDIEKPSTWEGFKAMLQAFVDNDPDGKGAIGLTLLDHGQLNTFSPAWTGYSGWAYVNDELTYDIMDDQYKEFIRCWADLYEAGLIDKELYSNSWDDIMQRFASGRAGVLLMNQNQLWWDNNYMPLTEYMPEASIANIVPPMEGPAGNSIRSSVPFHADLSFSAEASPEVLEKMLTIMDYLLSDEGRELTLFGIEGEHHEVIDGKKVQLPIIMGEWGQKQHILGELADFGSNDIIASTPQVLEYYDWQDIEGNVLIDYTGRFSEPDGGDIKVSLDEVAHKWVVSFITGQSDIDAEWETYLAEMEDVGYSQYKELLVVYLEENKIALAEIERY